MHSEKITAVSERCRRKKKADVKVCEDVDEADTMETTEELEQLEIKDNEADTVKVKIKNPF